MGNYCRSIISGSALSGTRRHCALSSASKRQTSPFSDISNNPPRSSRQTAGANAVTAGSQRGLRKTAKLSGVASVLVRVRPQIDWPLPRTIAQSPIIWSIDFASERAAALPFTKDITAWNIKGLDIVRLQDAAGAPVIDFTEVESGIFEGLRQGEGIYILQNLAAARSLAKSMDQMIGDWAMVHGNGQPICGLTLTNNEAGPDNFQVFLKPKCDPAISTFAPTQWRLDHGQMLLMSQSGETWQFEADDNAQWRRVPDSADPLIMLRQ